jgi:hypothetical protein
MDASGEPGNPPKKPRTRRVKKPTPAGPEVRPKHLRLSAEAWERLRIHATKERKSESAVVEGLIKDHLRRWVISDRGGPAEGASAA